MITSRTKEDIEKEMLELREEVRNLNKKIEELTEENNDLRYKVVFCRSEIRQALKGLDYIGSFRGIFP